MTTTIKLSPNNKTYEIWYTNNGTDYKLHKKGITTIDEAMKETTIIKVPEGQIANRGDIWDGTNIINQ